MHITQENKPVVQMKVVELYTQGCTPLSPAVALILADMPLVKASITIWGAKSLELQSSGIHNVIHCLSEDFQGVEADRKVKNI
jgi:hypothetical protein